MKREGVFNFLGACVIAIAIVVSGVIIAGKIPQAVDFPPSIHVTTDDVTYEFGDYLSTYEAAAYLGIATDSFMDLIQSGELDGVFYKVGKDYIISKQALQEWAGGKIET